MTELFKNAGIVIVGCGVISYVGMNILTIIDKIFDYYERKRQKRADYLRRWAEIKQRRICGE